MAKLLVAATRMNAAIGLVTSLRYGGRLTFSRRRRRACSGSLTVIMSATAVRAESALPNRKMA